MTRAERKELGRVARVRAKVAKSDVEAERSRLLADFEAQLAARYAVDDARWREVTEDATRAAAEADERWHQPAETRASPRSSASA